MSDELMTTDFDMGDFLSDLDGIDSIDFDQIKIPGSGGTMWEIPSDDPDNPTNAKSLDGVIVFNQANNVYYSTSFDGSNNPPDCSSDDGKIGFDSTTGFTADCASCPRNQFGSSGKGKACQNRMKLFILLDDYPFPFVLNLPATSLKAFKDYLVKRVIFRKKRLFGVRTSISLKRVKSGSGIPYSTCVFNYLGDVEPDQRSNVLEMRDLCQSFSRSSSSVLDSETPSASVSDSSSTPAPVEESDPDFPF